MSFDETDDTIFDQEEPESNLILRTLYIDPELDDAYRRLGYLTNTSKGEIMRMVLEWGRDVINAAEDHSCVRAPEAHQEALANVLAQLTESKKQEYVMTEQDASFFPVLIRQGGKVGGEIQLRLCQNPSELPVGGSFKIVFTNSSEKELEMARKFYQLGWEEGCKACDEDYYG